ncbi:M50 family metallopeptidase [Neobacillus cucumis]|uniref:M50 family metallopeptidase n=1 Tax=Neobacillus cucumis TaxID=1740721 RepID=UPI002853272A|nr:M50 family metallopeptidase [Neobacillus cucumis]MDR4949679.1 M50 family metallopeptidase [Neobacillus cucumis]
MNATTLIFIYLGVALVGGLLPLLRVFFAHFHNLVNLMVSACLEGGKIHLYLDGSGQTTGSQASPFKKALISYAGYSVASLVGIGLLYLVTRGNYQYVIYLYLGLAVLALLLWIRNAFGVIWGLSVVALLAAPIYFRYNNVLPVNVNVETVLVHMSIFLASVLFVQSLIGAFQVCRQSFMSRSNPKRKVALVQTKYIPAAVLGIILFGQTVLAGYFFALNFISLPFSLDMNLANHLLDVKNQLWTTVSGKF